LHRDRPRLDGLVFVFRATPAYILENLSRTCRPEPQQYTDNTTPVSIHSFEWSNIGLSISSHHHISLPASHRGPAVAQYRESLAESLYGRGDRCSKLRNKRFFAKPDFTQPKHIYIPMRTNFAFKYIMIIFRRATVATLSG
jgi:hypothetical protein